MRFDFDMIVIGGGAAGLTAASMSALLGAKTALIEERRLGGDCTWFGCVPSKALLKAAKVAHDMRTADRFGLVSAVPQFDFGRVMEHVRQIRQQIYQEADAPPRIEKFGVHVVTGSASFIDSHSLRVEQRSGHVQRYSSRLFVIATGSRPRMPVFTETPLTNETVFELQSRPNRLVVIGAGPVGIELAQAFTRLGSKVEVVFPGSGILPRDDAEHAGVLRNCLAEEGVSFRSGRKATNVSKMGDVLTVTLDNGETLACDAALAAMGRQPATQELQLENAGVSVGDKGILVDAHCRTSQRHIYGVGDVTGKHNFTHMAEHMSKVAVTNAILRWPSKMDEKHVVWSTFTDPELAHLGASETMLRERHARYSVFRFPFKKLDRAIVQGAPVGGLKIFASSSGRILGANILGENAGEMISEYALAMRHGLRLSDISETIHPYPTYSLGNRRAADRFAAKELDSPLLALLGRVLAYGGTRNGSSALVDDE